MNKATKSKDDDEKKRLRYEKRLAKKREWYAKNKEKTSAYNQKYYKNNVKVEGIEEIRQSNQKRTSRSSRSSRSSRPSRPSRSSRTSRSSRISGQSHSSNSLSLSKPTNNKTERKDKKVIPMYVDRK